MHVCANVIREIKHPFQDNAYSLIMHTLYKHVFLDFLSCDSVLMYLCVQLTWHRVEHPIA